MTADPTTSERLTPAEREVSQRLSQGFAWPTVVLLAALIAWSWAPDGSFRLPWSVPC